MGPGGVGQLAAGHAEDLDGRRRPALAEVLAEAPVRLVAVVGRPPVDAQQLRVVAALVEQPELLGGDGAVVRGPEEPRVGLGAPRFAKSAPRRAKKDEK